MEHLFYFFGILFLVYYLYCIAIFKQRYNKLIEFEKYSKNGCALEYMPTDIKTYAIGQLLIGIPLIIWFFTGLLTSQWIVFLIYLFTQLVVFGLINKILKNINSPLRYTFLLISALFGFTAIIFIILNKYHLQIDVYKYILDYFFNK